MRHSDRWNLKAGFRAEIDGPAQYEVTGHCLNCGDGYSELEMVEQLCFGCRLVESHRNKTKLRIVGEGGFGGD